MRPPAYITKVDLLDGGDVSRLYRRNVDDQSIGEAQRLLRAASEAEPNEKIPIASAPEIFPCELHTAASGGSLLATISWCEGKRHRPLATIAVARKSQVGPRVWGDVIHLANTIGLPIPSGLERPGAPWCAVVIHPGSDLLSPPFVTGWIDRFTAELAWGWVTPATTHPK